jgi:hypothetical protein
MKNIIINNSFKTRRKKQEIGFDPCFKTVVYYYIFHIVEY